LGVRQGFLYSLQPLWPYAISGPLHVLLQSEESRKEVVGELQWSCWESSSNSLSAVIQGLQREVLQDMLQQVRPCPVGRISPLLGGETMSQNVKVS